MNMIGVETVEADLGKYKRRMSFVSYLLVMGKRCCLRDHSLSWASIMIMAETNCIIRHLLRN